MIRGHFQAVFPDIFANYQNPPITGDVAVANMAGHKLKSTPFDLWENQLNFAVWCATVGCGVSFEDHHHGPAPQRSLHLSRVLHRKTDPRRVARRPSRRCPIPGTRTLTMPGSPNGFAMSSVCRLTGGRSLTVDVKASAVIASI